MKIQPLPITNLKVQPPQTAGASLRGKVPLQELQQADVFFSSRSIRAQLSEVLANSSDSLVKMFTFTRSAPAWMPFLKQNPSALIVEKHKTAKPETTVPSGDVEPEGVKVEPLLPQAPDLQAHWIYYSTVFKPDFLLRVYQLPFAKPSLKPSFVENRIAYIEKTGAVLTGNQIQQAGIIESYRPNMERFLNWVRAFIPQSETVKQFLDITDAGTLRLMGRWDFDLVRRYRDAAGNPVKFYDMARLPNNMIVQVEKKEAIADANSLSASDKKVFKEKVLATIDQAEVAGNHLLETSVVPKVPLPSPGATETPKQPFVPATNPFMTNPFTVTRSQQFIATKVANIPPVEASEPE